MDSYLTIKEDGELWLLHPHELKEYLLAKIEYDGELCLNDCNYGERMPSIFADINYNDDIDKIKEILKKVNTILPEEKEEKSIGDNICSDCGDVIDGEHYHYDGSKICEKCYDEYYFTCKECGEISHESEGICFNCNTAR